MANIFKTTLKKDVIADIANCGKREVRFPITKFWATRLTNVYNIDKKTFEFKTFDSLELSSPSNKETGGETYVFDFDRIFVDGDEFVVMFNDHYETEMCQNDNTEEIELNDKVSEVVSEECEDNISNINYINIVDDVDCFDSDILHISDEDVLSILTQWFEDEKILDNFYENDTVFATNAKQIIVLPKGRVLGSKKTLPLNNDVEVRIEFDLNKKIYIDTNLGFDVFEDNVLNILNEIRKNNFVFVWKRFTGIFMDDNGIYFGIKYSTRKSIGFNRKYNVQ
jgi:hypothetical protein